MIAAAIDLGSTRLKAGVWNPEEGLVPVAAIATPPLTGQDRVREGDARQWLAAATTVRDALAEYVATTTATATSAALPLALATQRSSFLLWRRADGEPVTPFISWQDTRGGVWCDDHPDHVAAVTRATGLMLNGHHAAPKLAAVLDGDPEIVAAARNGDLCFGTLETFLLWCWTHGRIHRTDVTVAARTGWVARGEVTWSDALLTRFNVPSNLLPEITPWGHSPEDPVDVEGLAGMTITATLADQAAAARAVLGGSPDSALVNLGTGGFVLHRVDGDDAVPPGFLAGPSGDGGVLVEGPLNGIGPALLDCGGSATGAAAVTVPDGAFCLPDASGLGAPHWRPEVGLTWSQEVTEWSPNLRRRVVAEGIVFRVTELVQALSAQLPNRSIRHVWLAGGMAAEPLIHAGLGAVLGRFCDATVAMVTEPEATLLGAAQVAAGRVLEGRVEGPPDDPGATMDPVVDLDGVVARYPRWRDWMGRVMDGR